MNNSKSIFFFIVNLLLVTLVGCAPLPETVKEFDRPLASLQRNSEDTARLSCFLTLKDDYGPTIRIEITSIDVFTGNLWLPLTSRPLKIDSAEIGQGQIFLGSNALPPGQYERIRLKVNDGQIKNAEGKYIVIAPEPFELELNLYPVFKLEDDDSSSIFITWDVKDSLPDINTLDLVMSATPGTKQLPVDIIYVSCPDIDTIFVVRTDKNWVVNSFGLKGGPTFLNIPPYSRKFMYVLASDKKQIKVIDLATYHVVNFFPVPLNDKPTFMTISQDGREAFLLDENNGYLTRIDLTTGQSLARVFLGNDPSYLIYLEKQNMLAVSLSLSNKILLLNPLNLRLARTIAVGNKPEGLSVVGNYLYVAEYDDNSVSIVDLSNNTIQSQMMVGFGPRRLLDTGHQIFVSNYLDGSLSLLLPGELEIIQEIYGFGRPKEMVFNATYRRVYVADEKRASLTVVDTNSNQIQGHIVLGSQPFAMDIIQ